MSENRKKKKIFRMTHSCFLVSDIPDPVTNLVQA